MGGVYDTHHVMGWAMVAPSWGCSAPGRQRGGRSFTERRADSEQGRATRSRQLEVHEDRASWRCCRVRWTFALGLLPTTLYHTTRTDHSINVGVGRSSVGSARWSSRESRVLKSALSRYCSGI